MSPAAIRSSASISGAERSNALTEIRAYGDEKGVVKLYSEGFDGVLSLGPVENIDQLRDVLEDLR